MAIELKDILALGDTFKMVVLIEKHPLSDDFEQIMLTPEHYKCMTAALFEGLPRCNEFGHSEKCKMIVTNDEVEAKMPNVRHVYTKEQIDKAE